MVHDQSPRTPAAVQEMFQRVITGWAMDALALRRRGLDRPTARDGAVLALPGRQSEEGPLRLRYPDEERIGWRRGRAA